MSGVPRRFFGPTRRQRLADALAPLAGALTGAALVAVITGPVRFPDLVGPLLGALIASAMSWLALSRQGMTVSPYGVEVRRGLRRRWVSWADVRDVQVHCALWGSRSLRLLTTTGTVRTRYPSSSPLARDPAFDDKVVGIRGWWRAHRPSSTEGAARRLDPLDMPP